MTRSNDRDPIPDIPADCPCCPTCGMPFVRPRYDRIDPVTGGSVGNRHIDYNLDDVYDMEADMRIGKECRNCKSWWRA